jgi:molybdate transport system ATP-binding protein
MGVSGLLPRQTQSLSGGERQRVAIARAVLAARSLLILDEPLASLDQAAREELLPRLSRLRSRLQVPMIYVTHAVDEAARFADEMAYMESGRIVAEGAVETMLTRLDLPLARRPDAEAIVTGRVRDMDGGYALALIDTALGEVRVGAGSLSVGDPVRIRIRARDVSIAMERPGATSILNVFPVRVAEVHDEGGSAALIALEAGGVRLLSRLTRRSVDHLGLVPGKDGFAQVKSVAVLS